MTLFWTVVLVVTATAAWTDLRTGRIPNPLTAAALAFALVAHAVVGFARGGPLGGLVEVGWSVAGALVCAAPVAVLFARGALGGGDLKLFAALGAILHPLRGLEVEVYALVVAAIVATARIVYRGALLATLLRSTKLLVRAFGRRRSRGADEADAIALPPDLAGWLRLGPSILAGAAIAWWVAP
jgi:prepilin peptidase CpaA